MSVARPSFYVQKNTGPWEVDSRGKMSHVVGTTLACGTTTLEMTGTVRGASQKNIG